MKAALASAFIWATYSLLTQRVQAFHTAAIGSFGLVSGLLSLACHFALETPVAWAVALQRTCAGFPGITIHTLPGWRQIAGSEIATAAGEVGGSQCKDMLFELLRIKRDTGPWLSG